jgi:hypothetical protein
MKNKIALLSALGMVVAVGAAAQGTKGPEYAAKEAQCVEKADARDFGIHEYQRHRFVIRCIAGLSH